MHARAQLYKRYKLRMSTAEYVKLCRRAAKNGRRSMVIDDVVGKRRTVALKHAGHWVCAVYDPRSKCIVTFLPRDNLLRSGRVYRALQKRGVKDIEDA